jgi:hypothetical protein
MRSLILVVTIAVLALQVGCIGRQPMQQGTWSPQDGFKAKTTDTAGHSPANPDKG